MCIRVDLDVTEMILTRSDFLFFSPFLGQKITIRPPKNLYAFLDPKLGAMRCGTELTRLGATGFGTELC
jgi:hypothetical protein